MIKPYPRQRYLGSTLGLVCFIFAMLAGAVTAKAGCSGWLVTVTTGVAGVSIIAATVKLFLKEAEWNQAAEEEYDEYAQALSDEELLAAINDHRLSRGTRRRLSLEQEIRDDI